MPFNAAQLRASLDNWSMEPGVQHLLCEMGRMSYSRSAWQCTDIMQSIYFCLHLHRDRIHSFRQQKESEGSSRSAVIWPLPEPLLMLFKETACEAQGQVTQGVQEPIPSGDWTALLWRCIFNNFSFIYSVSWCKKNYDQCFITAFSTATCFYMIVFTTKIDFDPIKQQNWVLLGSPQGRPYRCLLGSYLACRVHHKQLRSVYLYMYISAHLLHTEELQIWVERE